MTHRLLEVCLISRCLEDFLLSFCYGFLVRLFEVIEHTLYDFNSFIFVEICLLTQVRSILVYVLSSSWKECVCVECSTDVDRILLAGVLLSFHRFLLIFTPVFLFSC